MQRDKEKKVKAASSEPAPSPRNHRTVFCEFRQQVKTNNELWNM